MTRLSAALFAALLLPAGTALARESMTPPSSGITVHLFGPNSVLNNVIPGGDGGNGGATASTPENGASAAPDNGSLLHEMFVTGDPSVPSSARLSKGKTGGQ
ncbi:hypothetical protein [Acidocella sp. KAb 2-4]|uniref:hypothetical protein n=1 Tax=Acidocella sp. KAb 2-4 TaxID=2885158 RepID=UPI001D06998A|nr:hypothetical protein [Acidocella sp. KAb 2-4]MCB5943396.1 hypothetical protein [Acidocella sp. KAb 2-4]